MHVTDRLQNIWCGGGGRGRVVPETGEGRGERGKGQLEWITGVIYSRGGKYATRGGATQSVILRPAEWALLKSL